MRIGSSAGVFADGYLSDFILEHGGAGEIGRFL